MSFELTLTTFPRRDKQYIFYVISHCILSNNSLFQSLYYAKYRSKIHSSRDCQKPLPLYIHPIFSDFSVDHTSQILLLCVQLLQMSIFSQELQVKIQKVQNFWMSIHLLSLEEMGAQAHGMSL